MTPFSKENRIVNISIVFIALSVMADCSEKFPTDHAAAGHCHAVVFYGNAAGQVFKAKENPGLDHIFSIDF